MKLSNRLQTIADMIDTKSIIDIGCDHALLDIYLTKERNIQCTGTDIHPNAIKNAMQNIEQYHLKDRIKIVLTDGLTNILVNKEDTIVLSGMGTNTILNILNNFYNENKIIISSHNELEKLRKKMVKKHYKIEQEKVIFEKDKCYVIIKFVKGKANYHWDDYLLGPYAKQDLPYLQYINHKYHNISKKIPNKYWIKKIKLYKIKNKIKKLINSF